MGVLLCNKKCASLFTSREVNVVTRLVPSSGRLSPMSTVSTLPVPTTVTPTSSWSASTCTTTRLPEVATCPVPSSWTSSLVPWTLFALVLSVSSSALTTSSSARPVLVTTGPRVTTPKVPSSSTPCSTSSARRPVLRLPPGLPALPLPRWWYRCRYGNSPHLQDPRGVPRSCDAYLLRGAIA